MKSLPFIPGRVAYHEKKGLYEDIAASRDVFYEEQYPASHPTMHLEDAEHKFAGIELVFDFIDAPECHTVLDVGCGACDVLRRVLDQLQHRALTPVAGIGLDVSERILASGVVDNRIIRLRGDSRDLPFESSSLPLALCIDIIEHVSEPSVALREIRRVCQSVIFKVPLERSLYTTLRGGRRRLARLRDKYGHVNQYDRIGLLQLLSEHFEIIAEEYVPIPRRSIFLGLLQKVLLSLRLRRLYAATVGGFVIILGRSRQS